MTLQEILNEISEKYPHGLDTESVVRKINLVQNEVFRIAFKNPMLSVFSLIKGVFVYTVPFPLSNLLRVVADGRDYNYQDIHRKSEFPFYYFIGANSIAINPTPKENVTDGLAFFHYKYPVQVSPDELNVVPELDEDFHMILVYGTLVHICESFEDVAMVNNFTMKYNGLLTELKQLNGRLAEYPTIRNVWEGLL